MEKNKIGKYLKYAIGEIILVVIGILIALSVNNLNQERKNNSLKKSYLKNLKFDIKKDLENLEQLNTINTSAEKAGYYLADFLDNNSTEIDSFSLAKSIVFSGYIPNPTIITSTYNDLINSNNIHLFNDMKLKRLLNEYYIRNNWVELFKSRILKTAWHDYRDEMLRYHSPLLYKDLYAEDYSSKNNLHIYKIQWNNMKNNEYLKTQVGMIGAYRISIRNDIGTYIRVNKSLLNYLEKLE